MRYQMLSGVMLLLSACSQGSGNNVSAARDPGNFQVELRDASSKANPGPAIDAPISSSAQAGWQTTPSGLRYRRVSGPGTGAKPTPTDVVTIHYVGRLTDGTEFDSSLKGGEPVTFPLPDLIPGWQEGVPLMGVGDVYEFIVPPDLGYGPGGSGPIPPNATLNFRIGLIAIEGR